jgi:hypothetical protein
VPALPAVPNVLRVTLLATMGSDVDVLNRFYLQYAGTAPTNAQLSTLAAGIGTDWGTDLKAKAISAYILEEVEITDLSSPTGALGTATIGTAGTRAGSAIAAGSAVVLQFHIARRYRGGHPRIYLPYFGDTDVVTPQTWGAASLTALVSSWNAFITAILARTWAGGTLSAQVNVSYYQGFHNVTLPSGRETSKPTLRGTPVVDLVASVSANPHICSQRRRNQSS